MKDKKYPILEKAKKERKVIGAKGYSEYMTQLRNNEYELLKAKVEMRKHILERIRKIYEVDLDLYIKAEAELAKYEGKEATK